MRALVTGGSGYIGSKVVEKLLQNNIQVRCYDSLVFGKESLVPFLNNPNFELVKGDITNYRKVGSYMFDCDAIIHLAALVFTGGKELRDEVFEVNYNATRNLIDCAVAKGINKFIFTSTCSNYGTTKEIATESSSLQATNPYAESKIKAEKYILENHKTPTILRLSTAFGLSQRMRFDLLVNEMTRDAVEKKKITVYNPEAWRPGLHVVDIAKAIYMFLFSDKTGVYNVGHDSLNYQKKKLCDLLQNNIPRLQVETKESSSDLRNYKVSFDKLKRDFDFQPQHTFNSGIFEIMKALHQNKFKNPYDKKYQNLEWYSERQRKV